MSSKSEQAVVDLKKFKKKNSNLSELEEIYSKPIEGNTLHALTNTNKQKKRNQDSDTTDSDNAETASNENKEMPEEPKKPSLRFDENELEDLPVLVA
jgi:hypothetical protein